MFKKSLVVFFVLCWIALAIDPVDRGIWMLENILVVTVFPVVLWLDKKYRFTNWAFLGLTLFVTLHLFGANLTYENMAWFTWLSDWFGWERNYYDQVIHFLFGLLVCIPLFEIFYHQGHSRKLSYLIAFLFISSISAWYEVLEWIAMLAFCNEPGCLQLVTQGDEWDTQKDMAYAVGGACIALLMYAARHAWSQSQINRVRLD
jgi:putative membrane protein